MAQRELARTCRAWPFEEARKLLRRLGGRAPAKGHVLLETGYGPSGLPHIGTFAEVARTAMVARAFALLCDTPAKIVAFSDDMDALRAVPDNLPRPQALAGHLGRPLSSVPNPYGTEHESYGDHNNARLMAFLKRFGFEAELMSATRMYREGRFDAALLQVLERFDEVMAIMLPTLGEERRRTFSPFLPLSPGSGRLLQTPTLERRPQDGTIVFADEDGRKVETPVTGGHCKLGWKTDWAMRWHALGVDYEMAGKDLTDSRLLSGRICRALGSRPPEGFIYELFLDRRGEKISKSRGNGMAIEEWLRYGTEESLALFLYSKPRTAKRLHFDVIGRHVDAYGEHLARFAGQSEAAKLENPAWHIHGGAVPADEQPLGYAMLLNLAAACNADDKATLWAFIARYLPGAAPGTRPLLDRMAAHAVHYYRDFVKPAKRYRAPDARERAALEALSARLAALPDDAGGERFQNETYAVGREHGFEPLRAWFRALYEVLLGQSAGPRFGGFVALYGRRETLALIARALAGALTGDEGGRGA